MSTHADRAPRIIAAIAAIVISALEPNTVKIDLEGVCIRRLIGDVESQIVLGLEKGDPRHAGKHELRTWITCHARRTNSPGG